MTPNDEDQSIAAKEQIKEAETVSPLAPYLKSIDDMSNTLALVTKVDDQFLVVRPNNEAPAQVSSPIGRAEVDALFGKNLHEISKGVFDQTVSSWKLNPENLEPIHADDEEKASAEDPAAAQGQDSGLDVGTDAGSDEGSSDPDEDGNGDTDAGAASGEGASGNDGEGSGE